MARKNVWKSINKALKKDSKLMRGAGKALATANDAYAELTGKQEAALAVVEPESASILSKAMFYPAAGAALGLLLGGNQKGILAVAGAVAGYYFRDKLAEALTGNPTIETTLG